MVEVQSREKKKRNELLGGILKLSRSWQFLAGIAIPAEELQFLRDSNP